MSQLQVPSIPQIIPPKKRRCSNAAIPPSKRHQSTVFSRDPQRVITREQQSSSIAQPHPIRHQGTVSSRDHSTIHDWLSKSEFEPLSTPETDLVHASLKRKVTIKGKNNTAGQKEDSWKSSSKYGPQPKLTRSALKELEKATMGSNVSPSEDTGVKESNMGTYHPDFIMALYFRGVRFSNRELRPDNLSNLEQAMETNGSVPDLDQNMVDSIQQLREEGIKEIDGTTNLFNRVLPFSDGPCGTPNDQCIHDQFWDTGVLIRQDKQPPIVVPKADRAFGWSRFVFPFPKAIEYLGCAIRPVPTRPQLTWPYLTIELKGETGSLRVASLQSLHNGSTMVNNLLLLKQAAGNDDDFFGKIRALSVEFTTETITLSCYWATREKDGEILYHGRRARVWLIDDPRAKPGIFGAIRWMKEANFAWISKDMKELEGKLSNANHGMIPPPSRSGRGTGVKRKSSRTISRTTSQSSLRNAAVRGEESAQSS